MTIDDFASWASRWARWFRDKANEIAAKLAQEESEIQNEDKDLTWLIDHCQNNSVLLNRIDLNVLSLLAKVQKMSSAFDALAQQVTANTGVIESALTLIGGINKRIADGIAAAQAGDLTQLQTLQSELAAEDAKLAAAVAANTPSAGSTSATVAGGAGNDTVAAGSGATASSSPSAT